MAQQTMRDRPGGGENESRAREPAKGRGSTVGELEDRLARTEELMLTHGRDRAAAAKVAAEYEVHFNTGLRWCRAVRERWQAEALARPGVDREQKKQEHIERFRVILVKALEGKRLRDAVAAAERIAQLDGYLIRVEHSGPNGGAIPLESKSDAELEARLKELEGIVGGSPR